LWRALERLYPRFHRLLPLGLGSAVSGAFAALGLGAALVRAAAESGYVEPTPVQAAAIPLALQRLDLIACAQTGSGKTAAFGLPLLQRLLGLQPAASGRKTVGLVLVPTRELAIQVGESIRAWSRRLDVSVKVAVVYGGVSVNPQMISLLGGAEVLVATPGRLLDLVVRRAVKLGDVDVLVLDEADRLLEEGFADELAHITALLPSRRQSLLFSATFPSGVEELARGLMHDPVRVNVPTLNAGDSPRVQQRAIAVDAPRRTALLRHLLVEGAWPRVLVFVATRYATEHVADKLRAHGVAAAAFHGELSQGARTRVLADFRGGALQVVLATDMAARGLHIDDLPVVVNFDLPRSAADYTHRIGRTARAGASGLAVSFVSPTTEAHWRLIEKRQGHSLARERIAGFEPSAAATAAATATATATAAPSPEGGVKGRRKSKKDELREAAARKG
jgi:ATP-dependent RNA helicase RhlE